MDCRPERRPASFETLAMRASQDEVFSYCHHKLTLILRRREAPSRRTRDGGAVGIASLRSQWQQDYLSLRVARRRGNLGGSGANEAELRARRLGEAALWNAPREPRPAPRPHPAAHRPPPPAPGAPFCERGVGEP